MGIGDWIRNLAYPETPQIAGLRNRKLHKAGSFSVTGTVLSVAGGSGATPGKQVLASRVIPNGAALQLENWSVNVIDPGNSNQVYFAMLRNGSPISSSMTRVPGETFGASQVIDVGELILSGTIEIVAYNISGMLTSIEPDALDVAVAVRCQGWFTGTLMSERGGY